MALSLVAGMDRLLLPEPVRLVQGVPLPREEPGGKDNSASSRSESTGVVLVDFARLRVVLCDGELGPDSNPSDSQDWDSLTIREAAAVPLTDLVFRPLGADDWELSEASSRCMGMGCARRAVRLLEREVLPVASETPDVQLSASESRACSVRGCLVRTLVLLLWLRVTLLASDATEPQDSSSWSAISL